jgi:hypothetical protein
VYDTTTFEVACDINAPGTLQTIHLGKPDAFEPYIGQHYPRVPSTNTNISLLVSLSIIRKDSNTINLWARQKVPLACAPDLHPPASCLGLRLQRLAEEID